jgi:hypothetical protein
MVVFGALIPWVIFEVIYLIRRGLRQFRQEFADTVEVCEKWSINDFEEADLTYYTLGQLYGAAWSYLKQEEFDYVSYSIAKKRNPSLASKLYLPRRKKIRRKFSDKFDIGWFAMSIYHRYRRGTKIKWCR